MNPNSVVRSWLDQITYKQQAVLFCALRGCDGLPADNPSKPITRGLRRIVLRAADYGDMADRFMPVLTHESIDSFLTYGLDQYPMHWLIHTTHAVEIVGFKHPELNIRMLWDELYRRIADILHLSPELEVRLDLRLKDPHREIEEYAQDNEKET